MPTFEPEIFEESVLTLPPYAGCKGSIVRLKIQDFMTYQNVELYAGPHVNLIMGPNGTGKSTIVCAICLALAGKPKILGRAHALKEYIRHGASVAKVEVELYNPNGQNYVVKRVITETPTGASTDWILNKSRTTQIEIDKLMKSLNIQLDNLCQFLPQDRVQDFAKMDSIALLQSTEKSIGDDDLATKHEELIKIKENISKLESTLKKEGEALRIEQQQNQRLENEVQAFQESQKLKATIAELEGKKIWIHYKNCVTEFNRLEQEQRTCKDKKLSIERSLKPLRKAVANMEEELNKLRQQTSNERGAALNSLNLLKRKYDESKEKIESSVKEHKDKIDSFEKEERERQKRYDAFMEKLGGLEREFEAFEQNENKDDASYDAEIRGLDEKIRRLTNQIHDISGQDMSDQSDIRTIQGRMRKIQGDLEAMGEFRSSRLRYLERGYKDVYRAVLFFEDENNKSRFIGKIHEPLILQVYVNDLKYGKIAERHINGSDLVAFFCEDKRDMATFMEVMKSQGLRVSCIHHEPKANFRKPKSNFTLETMRQYDFQKSLIDIIEAPDYYMSFLCKVGRLEETLIGTEKTDQLSAQVIANLNVRRFYTSKYAYAITTSLYSKQKNSSIVYLYDAQIFTDQINAAEKDRLVKQMNEAKSEVKALESQIADRRPKLEEYKSFLNVANKDKKALKDKKEYKGSMVRKIDHLKQQIQALETEKKDLPTLREEIKKKISSLRKTQVEKLTTFTDGICKLDEKWMAFHIGKKQQAILQDQIMVKQNSLDESKAEESRLTAEINTLTVKIRAAIEASQKAKEAAKAKTGRAEPPKDITKGHMTEDNIDEEIHRINTQLGFLAETDGRIIKDYEERSRLIIDLQKSQDEMEKELLVLKAEQADRKEAWINPLQGLLQRINHNFANFFASMSCVGEVTLDHGEDEDDFAKYGVKIRVKFRSNEPLVELSGWKQSGGERAITTALYVLALQELTNVPFRVIDEINQGMDKKNETRFFNILCQLANGPNTPQYFLLTPKMLPEVEYPENVDFHIILNGPYINVTQEEAIAISQSRPAKRGKRTSISDDEKENDEEPMEEDDNDEDDDDD